MEAFENRFIKPFDTVVNFNEDFQSGSEPPGDTDCIADVASTTTSGTHSSRTVAKKKKTTLKVSTVRETSCKVSPQRCIYRHSSRKRSKSEKVVQRSSHHSCLFSRLSAQRHLRVPLTESERKRSVAVQLPEVHALYRSHLKITSVCPNCSYPDHPQRCANEESFWNHPRLYQSLMDLNSLKQYISTSRKPMGFIPGDRPNEKECNGEHVWNIFGHTTKGDDCLSLFHDELDISRNEVESSLTLDVPTRVTKVDVSGMELSSLRQELAHQTVGVDQVAKELVSMRSTEKKLRSQLNELKSSGSVKSETVLSLKAKIAELYTDVESLRCAHSQAIDHQTDLQEEVASLKRSRDWYEKQMRLAQSVRDHIEVEAERLRSLLKEGNEINHRLTHENACLQAQLACDRASLADAKRNLSRQLESIRVDMVEREAIFERIASERARLESLSVKRSEEVSELQAEVHNLRSELGAADLQMARQRSRLQQLEDELLNAESKRVELQETLHTIEGQYAVQENQLKEQMSLNAEALDRIKTLEATHKKNELLFSSTLEKNSSVAAALSAACDERDTLNSYLSSLKENMAKIEMSFEKVRVELELKNMQLTSVMEQRDDLIRQLKVTQTQIDNTNLIVEKLKCDKGELSAVLQGPRQEINEYHDSLPKPKIVLSVLDVAVQTNEYDSLRCLHRSTSQTALLCPSSNGFENVSPCRLWKEKAEIDFCSSSREYSVDRLCSVKESGVVSYVEKPSLLQSSEKQPPQLLTKQRAISPFIKSDTVVSTSSFQIHSSAIPAPPKVHSSDIQLSGNSNCAKNGLPQDQCVVPLANMWVGPVVPNYTKSIAYLPSAHSPIDTSNLNATLSVQESSLMDNPTARPSLPSSINLCGASDAPDVLPVDTRGKLKEESDSSLVGMSKIKSAGCHETPLSAYFGNNDPVAFDSYFHVPVVDLKNQLGNSSRPKLPTVVRLPAICANSSQSLNSSNNIICKCDPAAADQHTLTHDKAVSSSDLTVKDQRFFCNTCVDFAVNISENTRALCDASSDYCSPDSTGKELNNKPDCVNLLEHEKESLAKKLRAAIRKTSDLAAELTIAQREAEMQLRVADREIVARQQAINARQVALADLEHTREEMHRMQSEFEALRQETMYLREENCKLQGGREAYRFAHSEELQALRAIIKTTTEHLTTMSESLKQTHDEKAFYQSELARLKGRIRAQLERYRLFNRLESSASFKLSVGERSRVVADSLAAIGIDVDGLEDLLEEGDDLPLLHSKPIHGLNKCFETLQTEISQLEHQVVHHAMAVHDAVGSWSQQNESERENNDNVCLVDTYVLSEC
ncbi:hypothetical protein EG68_03275 [Paragonimus skrjabini miyazakii]|uniref:Uncharacterized protein n=1 Tax=Paragonimus skrjabini miyazakii TaxID=59628 RepID=A0A8S9YFK9_9TREM|nr:hypothetical protein EG68_03275 [Paragonimus skrjabini miyazakii]